ncbi:MAG TPA: flavodoxin domain-containing protein [Candidatus Sulfotelmatobacter sp.]
MDKIINGRADTAVSNRRQALHIVFASTSGHTEYVLDTLAGSLREFVPEWDIERRMAEKTQPLDLLQGDILLLASSTWNTGGIEGQLNPHMEVLLQEQAKDVDLAAKPCACIGLGDHRYFYLARAADRLQRYVETHHGKLILPTLKIVDEPYGQEETVRAWAMQLVSAAQQRKGS